MPPLSILSFERFFIDPWQYHGIEWQRVRVHRENGGGALFIEAMKVKVELLGVKPLIDKGVRGRGERCI